MQSEAGFNIVEKLLGITLLGSAWVLWLLIVLSIVSVAIILERTFFFWKTKLDFTTFNQNVSDRLNSGDLDGLRKLCEDSPALEAQVVMRALDTKAHGAKAMEETMSGFIIGQRQTLDRGLMVLGTLGNNAPFIGLFGTVLGIIIAFHELAKNPAGGPSVVMSGISEALIATAVGLMVAIPAVVAFNYFSRIVKGRMANAESVMKVVVAYSVKH